MKGAGTMLVLLMGLLAALASGCQGPTLIVQQYSGPVRPEDSIATFRLNGGDSVQLVTLDDETIGVPLASDSRLHIELLPGRHTLTVRDANAGQQFNQSITFQAEAGKVYRVAFVAAGTGEDPVSRSARVYEVDRGSDTPARDVTLPRGGASD